MIRSPRSIRPSDTPGRVLEHFPELMPTFAAHGFEALINPRLRATLGRVVTLRQACRRLGVDIDDFVAELNRRRDEETSLPPICRSFRWRLWRQL